MISYHYKIYCPKHQHLSAKVSHICAHPNCETRLICQLCTEHSGHQIVFKLKGVYSTYFILQIPISNFENALSGANILDQQQQQVTWPIGNHDILQFLKQADLNSYSKIQSLLEIRSTIDDLFKQFITEIKAQLMQIQNYLIDQMESIFKDAQSKLEYLKIKFIESFDLSPLAVNLKKYQQGQITLQALNGLFKSFFSKDVSQVKNIYNHLSQNGRNHNYLDIFQIDIKAFHKFKNKILSNFAQLESFKEFIPEHHQSFILPTQQKPKFSWNLIQKQSSDSLMQIKKTQKINKLHVMYSEPKQKLIQSAENPEEHDQELMSTSVIKNIISVIDNKYIAKYNEKGDFQQYLYQCKVHQQLKCVEFKDDFIAFCLNNPSNLINILYIRNGKIVRQYDSRLNNVIQICFINKYPLYQNQKISLLCLNQQGMIKIVSIFENKEVYNQPYGSGVKEVQILPDIRTVLNQVQSNQEDALYDLMLCSYSETRIKLAVRSIFKSVPISNMVEEESVEQQLGLIENQMLSFRIFKMTQQEKKLLSEKIDLANIDYLVVTLLGEIMTIWNWKTATFVKRFEVPEGLGLRVFPTIQNQYMNNILIIGNDTKIYNVQWLKQNIEANKFSLKHISSIHQISEYFVHFHQGSLCVGFLVALKDKMIQQQIFSIVNYQ